MRTVRRLRLRYFLLFTSLLMCCPLCYSLPCRNHDWPIKSIIHYLRITPSSFGFLFKSVTHNTQWPLDNAFGGPGGSRTHVQNTFLFASYSNKNRNCRLPRACEASAEPVVSKLLLFAMRTCPCESIHSITSTIFICQLLQTVFLLSNLQNQILPD